MEADMVRKAPEDCWPLPMVKLEVGDETTPWPLSKLPLTV
jgi:hypothetical protein